MTEPPVSENESESRTIKRYANRKLYDTTRSGYVTLDDVAEMIRAGEDVRVIDNRTQEDLTSVTLAQIIFEEQKSRRRTMPLSALRTIIQRPAELLQRFGSEVTQLRGEAARQVDKLRQRAETLDEGRALVLEATENLQRSVEEMQARLDDRVRDAVDALTHVPDLKRELATIRGRIERLEETCRRLTERVEASRGDDEPAGG